MATMTLSPLDSCVTLLVRLARELDVETETVYARELLEQAEASWGGSIDAQWWKWLIDAGASLGIPAKAADLSLEEAAQLARDGLLLSTRSKQSGELVLILGVKGGKATIASEEGGGKETLRLAELADRLQLEDSERARWLIANASAVATKITAGSQPMPPLRRLLSILRPEWHDIWVVIAFGFFVGLLALATPIAVEALVNTVAFGRFLQPVVVLSLMLMAFLAFAAAVLGLQTYAVEIIQRRLFARIACDLAYRLPRVQENAWRSHYGPELVNRFFDVTTLQKVSAHLLLDGVAIVLGTLIGMAVLGFYHPWLLGFDVLLLGLVVAGIWLLGRGAVGSGIEESKYKYRLASWLEGIAGCPLTFKMTGAAEFAADRANFVTSQYLTSRRKHFRILFRQVLFVLGLQAIAATVLLGFGGWLVIQGQLTLGQLVAAELIVAAILGSLAKLGKHLEGYYDLLAGVDKLGKLFDLPLERQDGLLSISPNAEVPVRFTEVSCQGGKPLSLAMARGERLAITGPADVGKSALLELIYGLRRPDAGHVEVFEEDPLDLRPDVLRRHVCLVAESELFEGTLAENVHVHRPGVTRHDVREALRRTGLLDAALKLPDGLETELTPPGEPLSDTQRTALLLARGLAGNPEILLIDGVLDRLPDQVLPQVLSALNELGDKCTIVIVTGRKFVVDWCDRSFQVGAVDPPASEVGQEH